MTLSFSNLNEIGNLYESIAASEQEQLNEGPYGADSIRAAQEAEKRREMERSNKEKQRNTNLQAAKDEENKAAPAGSSPKQMQQAAVQGMLDRQKARGGPNNGWNKDNLTKTINPKYTPQNVARAQQAVGIKPAITPTPTSRQPVAAPTRPAASAPTPTKVLPSKPVGSAMDQWRAANPKLAAAADEKARIRGTQQTDNPLMKDMRSRLPMNSPSVQAPSVAKLGAGNQSLVNNPNAFKAAPASSTLGQAPAAASKPSAFTPKTPTATSSVGSFKPVNSLQATSAAPSTSAAASGSLVPATNKIAAASKPVPLKASYEYDAYDLVLEYLLDNGHVDTVEEAHYVMMELDAETISEIAHGTGKRVMPSAAKRSKLATKARAGEDIGKPGKGFEKVAATAAKQYGSKKAGARVAAAAMFKAQAKKG